MSPPRQFRNVALVGFMGAGKSTVGYLLAELLRYELVDTDKVIEQRTGRRISDIFATDGEPAFRALESALVPRAGVGEGRGNFDRRRAGGEP
jgi:shikimate kinase